MLGVQHMDLSRRMGVVPWMLPSHHHYPPLPPWMVIITFHSLPGHSRHWVMTVVAPMSKGHHHGITILQRITQFHPQNITDRRRETRDALSSPSRWLLPYQRLPSTIGRPPRISTHPKSTKTERSRFPVRSAGRRSQQGINSGPAEKKRTFRNNRPPAVIAGRKRSQKCSGGLDDPTVCRSLLLAWSCDAPN